MGNVQKGKISESMAIKMERLKNAQKEPGIILIKLFAFFALLIHC
jgi:hypothetical protein